METRRLDKVEHKIDLIQQDVSDLKSDFKVHVANMEHKLDSFKNHIAGDEKIISHILPLIEEWEFKQKESKLRKERLKISLTIVSLVSLSIGIVKLII